MKTFLSFVSCACVGIFSISCSSNKPKALSDDFENFAIEGASAYNPDADSEESERDYYDRLEEVNESIRFKTSFPMFVAVKGSKPHFGNIPPVAQDPTPSRILLKVGSCQMFLVTGPVQVQRYIQSNQWIKVDREVASNNGIKMTPSSRLHVRMESQINLQVPKRMHEICRRNIEGKKIFVGNIHMNNSWVDLVARGDSKKKTFGKTIPQDAFEQIYIRWDTGKRTPIVRNDLDFPAIAKSPVYSTNLDRRGFYYLAFQPVLRLSTSDSLVVNIGR
jgi:hypothetical protein